MKLKKMAQLYISFFKIGGLTFGGGLAMLPMLQREVVENHHWCTEEEILALAEGADTRPREEENAD